MGQPQVPKQHQDLDAVSCGNSFLLHEELQIRSLFRFAQASRMEPKHAKHRSINGSQILLQLRVLVFKGLG